MEYLESIKQAIADYCGTIKLKRGKKVKPSDLIGNIPPDWIEELKKLNK